MKADSLNIPIKPIRLFKKFKTKISKYQHEEGDPKFDCKNYDEETTYNSCIEDELTAQFKDLIGCHPPLISDKIEKMCNNTFNLSISVDSVKKVLDLIDDIFNDFQSTVCKKPCTYFTYETKKEYSFTMNQTNNVIKLVLDKTVDLTKTSFLLGFTSLLTGLGGAISGGRTLLWFILTVCGIGKIVEHLILAWKKNVLFKE